jgi:hypothetical protein
MSFSNFVCFFFAFSDQEKKLNFAFLLDLDNKVAEKEKTMEDLLQRLQWIQDSIDKIKTSPDLKEKEGDINLLLQEREKLFVRFLSLLSLSHNVKHR